MDYDLTVRLCVVGDFGTGKTALLRKLQNPSTKLETQKLTPTIGIDFVSTIIEIDGKKIKLCIWDTAGQEAFMAISRTFYRNVAGFVYVFSLSDYKTLKQLDKWDNEINKYCENPYSQKIVVGNKSDLYQNIPDVDCYNKALQIGGEFIKTNAHNDVSNIFSTLVLNILENYDKNNVSIFTSNKYGITPKKYMEIDNSVNFDDEPNTCCVIS